MAKKAVLVKVTFVTRVIVDSDYEDKVGYEVDFINEVADNIIKKINNGETAENVESITDDLECPYED